MTSCSGRFALVAIIVFLAPVLFTVSVAGSSEWTAMFYIDGDNNLEYYGKVEMSEINDSVADTVALVLKDDADDGDTRLYHVLDGVTTELSPDWLDSEMNMGDDDTLYEFVNWTLSEYPSNRTFIEMWDHGGAFVGCCVDDTDGHDMLTLTETRTALSDALGDGERIDVIGYADCLMANTEVAYELRDVGSYMVGSEKVGWAYGSEAINWDHDDIIESMDTYDDPADVAAFVVSNGMDLASGMKYQSHTWSAINLTNMTGLMDDLNALATALDSAFEDHYWDIIDARDATESYEGPYGSQYDRVVDLWHFSGNIYNITSLPSDVRDAASAVMDELNVTVIAEGHHSAWLDNDEPCGNAHGLSINFPDARWKMWSYYTHSTRGPAEFVSDSEWDEFLRTYGGHIFVDDDAAGPGDGSRGDPYTSVQDGVDSAVLGNTVLVFEGTYTENVDVDVALTVVGNGSAVTEISADGGSALTISADDVTVIGLRLTDATTGFAGIEVAANDTTIKNVNATGNAVGIEIEGVDDCSVLWTNVSGNDVGIALVGPCPGTDIQNTTFHGNTVNLFNNGTSAVDAEFNHWGTVDELAIRSSIFDVLDDVTLGTVDYSPWYGRGNNTVYRGDVTAPTTTSDHDGEWHNDDITINLTAVDTGTGVDETYFRIGSGAWQTGIVIVVPAPANGSMDGEMTIEYCSVDRAGNNGTVVIITVHIDTTAPELRIWFDSHANRVRLHPDDVLDPSPGKTVKRSTSVRTYILTDHAGNVAKVKLLFSKSTGDGWTVYKIALTKVRHNDGPWTYFTSGERYALRARIESRDLADLEQEVRGSTWKITAVYADTTDSTRVTVSDGGWTASTEPGLCCADMFVSGNKAPYALS